MKTSSVLSRHRAAALAAVAFAIGIAVWHGTARAQPEAAPGKLNAKAGDGAAKAQDTRTLLTVSVSSKDRDTVRPAQNAIVRVKGSGHDGELTDGSGSARVMVGVDAKFTLQILIAGSLCEVPNLSFAKGAQSINVTVVRADGSPPQCQIVSGAVDLSTPRFDKPALAGRTD
jgi:hypothetical protein